MQCLMYDFAHGKENLTRTSLLDACEAGGGVVNKLLLMQQSKLCTIPIINNLVYREMMSCS